MLDTAEDNFVEQTNLSEMRVAKAASLALMLQDRAEPSLLFLSARIAMILQMLRTARGQVIKGLSTVIFIFMVVQDR